jgi:hypothetical protein
MNYWKQCKNLLVLKLLSCLKELEATVSGLLSSFGWLTYHIAKTQCRKFETNIPRKGILGPQSQFPHSCVCERIIFSHDGSACSVGGNM